MNTSIVASFAEMLMPLLPCFTVPTQASFLTLASAWVLCSGPRTVTNLIRTAGPQAVKSHDAYQYFFSRAVWDMDGLWKVLFKLLMAALSPSGTIRIAGDDTLLHHGGRVIYGAGVFRDAVRSKGSQTAFSRGHNWAFVCLLVRAPLLSDVYLALPIQARLRPKAKDEAAAAPGKKGKRGKRARKAKPEGPTLVDLMAEMLATLASWAPEREFLFTADAAYASVAGRLPSNVQMVSRIRCDAAIYASAPPRTGKQGRPRTKGERLPTPEQVAHDASTPWARTALTLYGQRVEPLLYVFEALWYEVCAERPVRIVCVRDPARQRPDAFFFSTDGQREGASILEEYSARWSVEPMVREAKQSMGIEGPQAQLRAAVERQAPFALMMLSLVKLWYVTRGYACDTEIEQCDPWYEHKKNLSFDDMLACLRRTSWRGWISSASTLRDDLHEILKPLIWQASKAA